MPPKRTVVLAAAVGLLVLAACEAGLVGGGFEVLENRSFDLRVRWLPPPQPPAPEIVIIDIDNPSFAALSEAVGRWPWTRRLWAELVKFLQQGKPGLIVFDAIFSGRESEEADREFAQAMAEAGNVALSYVFVNYQAEDVPGSRPATQEVPGAVGVEDGVGLPPLSPRHYKADLPLAALMKAARTLGATTATPDRDGLNRRVALLYRWQDRYYPSLALATAAQARGVSAEVPARLAPSELRWGPEASGLRVPVTEEGLLVPRWRPDREAFPRLPLWQVVCSFAPENCAEGKRFFAPEVFRDKIVIVGASAAGAFDVFATPVSEFTPGFLVHATALDSLLSGRAISRPPAYLTHLLVLLLAGLAMACVWGLRSALRSTLAMGGLVGVYLLVAAVAFDRWEVWLPVAAPLTALLASFAASNVTRYATTGRELRRTRQALSRYMSPKVVDHIFAHGGPDQLRGQRREITVMFSDVRNFTQFSEKRAPTEVLAVLNRYLDAMTEIVFAYDGVVDKFIGDGILCYWGAFGDADRHAQLAVTASAQMVAKLGELNENWRAEGLPELNIGIGINTGEAVFGNLGGGKKVEFTVLGDTVNVASRLEAMNKEFGTRIILSENSRAALAPEVEVRLLGQVAIRGREQKMKVYELLSLSGGETSHERPAETPARG
ncbi:MAG: adenylate/guanylate cyclase domain-containing protein [Acidobacteria bacterium]|nr:adenylate/guanylate cyclase domain-containing protein [Acidobacteriota bacterium]